MRAIIQRVTQALVKVDDEVIGSISNGLLVLLGIENADTVDDVHWLAAKIINMRIFSDENGLMNKSLLDVKGEVLLISQFTLFAQTKKGNRPGFTRAAKPEVAIPLYELMVDKLEELSVKKPQTGKFGADMKVSLINDGPVTIVLDTQDKDNH